MARFLTRCKASAIRPLANLAIPIKRLDDAFGSLLGVQPPQTSNATKRKNLQSNLVGAT